MTQKKNVIKGIFLSLIGYALLSSEFALTSISSVESEAQYENNFELTEVHAPISLIVVR